MLLEVVLTGKLLATCGAGMGADFEVNGTDVATERHVGAKGFGAGVTLEWTFVCVNSDVIGQVSSVCHFAVTIGTFERGI